MNISVNWLIQRQQAVRTLRSGDGLPQGRVLSVTLFTLKNQVDSDNFSWRRMFALCGWFSYSLSF